jgi:hypothetical protein
MLRELLPLSWLSSDCVLISMLSCDCSDADGADDSGSDSDEVSEDPASQWDVCHDDAGNAYFVNRITSESVWDKPDGFRCVFTCRFHVANCVTS